jgi:hypothetical protein
MKIDDIAKQLANKVNQEHYIKHYLEKVQRGAYNKGVKDAEAHQLILSGVSGSFSQNDMENFAAKCMILGHNGKTTKELLKDFCDNDR